MTQLNSLVTMNVCVWAQQQSALLPNNNNNTYEVGTMCLRVILIQFNMWHLIINTYASLYYCDIIWYTSIEIHTCKHTIINFKYAEDNFFSYAHKGLYISFTYE